MEAGVFALNRLRVRRLARTGNPSARLLPNFLEKPEKFLWTILVGNTVVNFFILGWFIAQLHGWFAGRLVLVTSLFVGFVFIFYAFFDLLPKMLFRAYPNRLCLSTANIFRLVTLAQRQRHEAKNIRCRKAQPVWIRAEQHLRQQIEKRIKYKH